MRDDVTAIERDLLLLASVGLDRLGMWKPASVVSMYLVDTTDDAVELCVAEAAVVWQTTHASVLDTTFREWEKLRDLAEQVGGDERFTAEEKGMCRVSYLRVSSNFVITGMMTSDLGRASLEKVRVVFASYLGLAK
jgi:hypothetical protein